MNDTETSSPDEPSVEAVLDRVRSREFYPVDETSFTIDRTLKEHGIADLDDGDWRVRLLAVRDLVRIGNVAASAIAAGLKDEDVQVRYVCATALGVLRARSEIEQLERVVREDPNVLARSQAIAARVQRQCCERANAVDYLSGDSALTGVRPPPLLSSMNRLL